MSILNIKPRTIFCRDNIDVLSGTNSGCIDLIYLDPPFNKNKVFTAPIGSSAAGAEFSDIFREEDVKDEWVGKIEYDNPELHEYLKGVKTFSNRYNYCYLVYMAIRLIECHRILKETGSIYLHCDPTMSHYLKIVMDCIFDEKNFRNEVIWCYLFGGHSKRGFAKKHDVILRYSKSGSFTFNHHLMREYETASNWGQREDGKLMADWIYIPTLNTMSKERTGYPTQKPLKLLETLVKASSHEGDVVMDPFCGCATTCIAAEKLDRLWIGVDVSHKAYELVKQRLKKEVTLFKPKEPNYRTSPPKRGESEERERGHIYIIGNANWENVYKVGVAKDPKRRLNSYQTSDPYRAYKLLFSLKTPHYKAIEKHIHEKYKAANEWVKHDVEGIVKEIKKYAKILDKTRG